MSPIEDRLAATLRAGIISGGSHEERQIAERQVVEAIQRIRSLEREAQEYHDRKEELAAHIAELEKAILARLLDVPEEERGGIAFVISVGCHLEKFAKSWRSSAWQITEERKIALKQVIFTLLTGGQPEEDLQWDARAIAIFRDMLAETEARQ
ncbi:hypothetical protein M0R72_11625 [Candidatus Pacearchaeota archaeon]|jgi:hypothetical protein|nr:hypothetical protein [Candidatus Pacearchaeota archaeon]